MPQIFRSTPEYTPQLDHQLVTSPRTQPSTTPEAPDPICLIVPGATLVGQNKADES